MSFNKFLEAVRNGDFNALQVENRSDFLNKKDENGNSAIQLAVINANLEMIKSLIRLGCDLDYTTEDYKTLVNLANQTDKSEKIEKILKNYKIAKSMNLSCNDNCNHNFCLISLCFNEFKDGDLVDKGRHGKITKVQDSNSPQIFAIKRISWKPVKNDDGKSLNEAKYVENNIDDFKLALIHQRMVHYYGASIERCKMFIFMEYVSGGSIYELIDKEFNDGLPCEKVLKYTQHILEGLEFLHTKKIIHRDIKPNNVLLDGDDNCKLTDFGFSRLIETIEKFTNSQYMESKRRKKLQEAKREGNEDKKPKTLIGTANYMTPEMIQGQSYSTECDIWSLGATVYHMYFGKPPFYGEKQNAVFMKLGKNEKPTYPNKVNLNKEIISLLDDMLVIDQNQRPSATDLLKKYFKKM